MRNAIVLVTVLVVRAGLCLAADANKLKTFQAYADSDLCARLMLGAISPERIECSQSTYKQGSSPVLVQLSNNTVFTVNKTKMLKEHVGKLVEATGEPKEKDGRIKLESVNPIAATAVPATCGSTRTPPRRSACRPATPIIRCVRAISSGSTLRAAAGMAIRSRVTWSACSPTCERTSFQGRRRSATMAWCSSRRRGRGSSIARPRRDEPQGHAEWQDVAQQSNEAEWRDVTQQ